VIFVNEAPGESSDPVAQVVKKQVSKKPVGKQAELPQLVPAAAAADRPPWDEMIQRTASQHQVDPDLVRAIVRVESNYNPYAVSPKGAKGLMQLIPATAKRFGVLNIFDPRANLDGGVRYLKYLMTLFRGDLKLSVAAYNAGENAIQGYNGVPPYRETQDYVRKVSALYPLSIPTPQSSVARIEKYVDSAGIVHFSNVDQP